MAKRSVKKYPLEFKQSSAKLAAESEQPLTCTAKALGVNKTTLHDWVHKYCPNTEKASDKQSPLEQELKRLRLENARLKQERDILKKAAAYFASEM